jgi:solute:Na+ symporter, SSS family
MTIPATLLFFGIGTALFAYYRTHPGRLDPTITTDQIFPLFIALEMPIGLAGLIVAGIFSAAQSTVSTSMNSTATTVVTDFACVPSTPAGPKPVICGALGASRS